MQRGHCEQAYKYAGGREVWASGRLSRKRLLLLPAFAISLCFLGACRGNENSKRAEDAVNRFHGELDRGEYEDAYADATDEFRNFGTRRQQLEMLKTVHEKLGNSGQRTRRDFGVTENAQGVFVKLVYRTEFAAGPADEYFVWRMDKDQPHLRSYHIDSPDLR